MDTLIMGTPMRSQHIIQGEMSYSYGVLSIKLLLLLKDVG